MRMKNNLEVHVLIVAMFSTCKLPKRSDPSQHQDHILTYWNVIRRVYRFHYKREIRRTAEELGEASYQHKNE